MIRNEHTSHTRVIPNPKIYDKLKSVKVKRDYFTNASIALQTSSVKHNKGPECFMLIKEFLNFVVDEIEKNNLASFESLQKLIIEGYKNDINESNMQNTTTTTTTKRTTRTNNKNKHKPSSSLNKKDYLFTCTSIRDYNDLFVK